MRLNEAVALLSIIKAAYPKAYRYMSEGDALSTAGLWAEMFKNEPLETVATAVKAHIATNKWEPSIGEIKQRIQDMKTSETLTAQEAWSLVSKATRNSLHNAKAEFEKLPKIVQIAVGGPEQLKAWANMEAEVVESVVASNFQKSYSVRAEREKETAMLPPSVKDVIGRLANGMEIPEITDGEVV